VAAKSKLGTTLGSGTSETNPPPVVGSTFIGTEGVQAEPFRTAGATTSAEDGRRLLLMVASSVGLPESFFGDVSVGTLATARSLDRPTELKFVARQSLWRDVLQAILYYVIVQAVKARRLKGTVVVDDDGVPQLIMPQVTDEKTGEQVDRDMTINVDFPPILEHDVNESVEAIVKAATLGGSTLASVIDSETVTRQLLTALGEKDIEALMAVIYPPEEERPEDEVPAEQPPEEVPPGTEPAPEEEVPPVEAGLAEQMMVDAVTELRQTLARIVEAHA